MVAPPRIPARPLSPAPPPPLPPPRHILGFQYRATPVPAHSDDVTVKAVTHHSPELAPLSQPPQFVNILPNI
ncbi:hypothetical protein E2C01_044160 [Portunus trituberculatus]|uniref:Uncharacterized protein n=1 Tax=Portunus trituberculatus TaxID=210409 RepID=A0A5B7FUV1_PORTR|nr:hypothetical protein [Portunus trituberculatus]